MTTNQLYAGMNRRFDARARLLIGLGFAYVAGPEGFGAAFTRRRFAKVQGITAAETLHATPRAWRDTLARTLQRGY